jgi:ABC-type multidrug transport system fused ATPase/permease subunit
MPDAPDDRNIVQDLSVLVEPGRRRRWVMLIGIAVVNAGLEAVGALLVFYATNRIAQGSSETVLDRFFDAVGSDQSLSTVALVIAVFFVIRGVFTIASKWYEARTVQLTAAHISDRLFRRYLAAPYREHLKRNSSELMRNTISSVEGVTSRFLTPIVSIASETVVILFLVTVLAITAPVATAVVAAVLGVVGFVLLRIVRRHMRRFGQVSESATQASLAVLQESLQDLRSIRIFGREHYFASLLARQRREFAHSRYSLATYSSVPRVGMETLVFVMLAAFLAASSAEGAAESFGVLGLFAYAALRIMPGVNRIVGGLNLIRFGAAAVGNVVNDLEGPDPRLPERRASGEALPWEALCFNDVAFQYGAGGENAVRDVNLTIRAGETIGVVGQTGSGKSTFIDLLLGLLEPTRGRMCVDDRRLDDVRDAWQQSIGIVSQDVYLLDDTIRRNVAFGVPPHDIDDDLVWECLQAAQLEGFVASSPQGLETPAGERGVSVSGGERQRIAIARALYRRPALLVLDEATSALDTATERDLMDEIRGSGARTVVMVAHRLSSVRLCDRIVVFDQGRIVDVGPYDDLARRNDVFGELVSAAG